MLAMQRALEIIEKEAPAFLGESQILHVLQNWMTGRDQKNLQPLRCMLGVLSLLINGTV